MQVYPAEVLSLSGQTCTVRLLASGLEVEGVRLKAEVDAKDYCVLYPKEGSMVLVGCIENDVANLFVAQFAETHGFDLIVGDLTISGDKTGMFAKAQNCEVEVNTDKVTIKQSAMTVELQGGKVSITNGAVSLKDVFDDLSSLIQNLKVITVQGPSTALFPDTIVALTAFKAKYPLLLS